MTSTATAHPRTSAPSIEANPHYHRWKDALHEQCLPPHIPDPLLAAYFKAAQAHTMPSVAQIAALLGCEEAEAGHWQLVLTTRLVSPLFYTPLWEAEDMAADRLIQRTSLAEDVKATAERLAAIEHEIATTKTYALLSEAHAEEVADTIQRLDQERVDLLRHQQRDLPAMAQLLKEGQAADTQRLERARARVQHAQAAHVTALEQAWREELRTLLAPVSALLERARQHLDPAWALQGRDLRNCGSARLRGDAVQQLRGEHTNA